MKTKLSIHSWLVSVLFVIFGLHLQAATVTTDKKDYAPGSIAIINGAGFKAGETIQVQVLHADGRVDTDPDHSPWTVVADANGSFQTTWNVCTDESDCVGQAFVVDASGLTSGLAASTTFTDSVPNDFHQAANNDGGWGFGNVHWINSILQDSNSKYAEGGSTLQRLIFSSLPATSNNVHLLKFNHQANKGATTHAYDFLTSWAQGISVENQLLAGSFTNVNTCGNEISLGAVCSGLHSTGFTFVVNAPDKMGTNIGDNIEKSITNYEARFGNRTVQIYGDKAFSGASLSFDGYTGSGDLFANYTMTWTSAATAIVIEFAGHIAAGRDSFRAGIGYGDGRGASSINGGPYHFKLDNVDGITLGSQDNQLKASDIFVVPDCIATNNGPLCVGSTLQLGTRTVTNATYAWTGPNGFTSALQNPVISNVTSAASGTYSVAVTLDSQTSTCTTAAQVNAGVTYSISSNNISCSSSNNGKITVTMLTGKAPFAFLWSNGSTNQNQTGLAPGYYSFTVADANGCSASGGATLGVTDTQPPVLTGIPPNTTVQCDSVPTADTPTATDLVDPKPSVTMNQTTSAGACVGSYVITRTWTATDACGNSTSKSQTITVVDTVAPVITGVPANATVQCTSMPGPASPTVSDNCDPNLHLTLNQSTNAGSCANAYTITRTWTATDSCGNSSTKTQTLTVVDTTAPVLSNVPADVTVQCNSVPTVGAPTATDNCDAKPTISFVETNIAGSCGGSYTLRRTWTATDACGNSSSKTQTITVVDTTAPVLSNVPPDATVQCNAVPSVGTPSATDNCDAKPTISFVETNVPGTCAGNYTLVRTWTATDKCGNSSSARQRISVISTLTPVLHSVPADATVSCTSVPGTATVTATAACDASPVVTFKQTSSPALCPGIAILNRTWTATDACGNSASATQHITIVDTNPPTLLGCPPDMTVTSYSDLPPAAFVAATNTCGGNAHVYFNEVQSAPGSSCSNVVTRTWTAANACGVTNSCTQHILVNDDIPPAILSAPADGIIGCSDTPSFGSCVFKDNCDTNLTVKYYDTLSLSRFGQFVYTRTWIATDVCGNATRAGESITQNGCNAICAYKFDDTNANGIWDTSEQGIRGWQIILTSSWGSITNYTDATGEVCFTNLPDGAYTVSEGQSLTSTWMALTPTSVSVTLSNVSQHVLFGNLCLGPGGGLTKGFWQNKNGQAAMTSTGMDGALSMLRNLNLRNYDGTDFDPKNYGAFQNWIKNAASKNAAFMLSAQLAAMELNVYCGYVDPTRLVYAPGVGNIGVGNNFITIADLMNAANATLTLHGYTVDSSVDRVYQTALETVIDNANNDRNFVQLNPCAISFPYAPRLIAFPSGSR